MRRVIICILISVMVLCPIISFADTIDETPAETEAIASEDDSAEDVSDNDSAANTETPDKETDLVAIPEESSDTEINTPAFDDKVKIDDVIITVHADEGVFPEGCSLSVEKVQKKKTLKRIEEAVDQAKEDAGLENNVAESFTYDIKVLDKEGSEIQPDGEVSVSFKSELVGNENLETAVYHVDDNETATILNGEEKKGVYTAVSDGFSYYTVEFTYNDLVFVMEGDTEIPLKDVLEYVGLTGNVSSVEGSNNELFSFKQKNGEWYIKANKAFKTDEWMRVAVDGIVYEIKVTDDINFTITYNSGSDGEFSDGTTVNAVSYSQTTRTETKYAHTPNVTDTGAKTSNYANNLSRTTVVTIPKATTLTVDIYYNGESIQYDWLSVWAGNYPSYTASSNYYSTGAVTTDMGAPNDNNKFGGSQSGSYTVNGNSLTNMGHCTLTISGDSVTFGFRSDSAGAGAGYGYYAIISGDVPDNEIISGTYKNQLRITQNINSKNGHQIHCQ